MQCLEAVEMSPHSVPGGEHVFSLPCGLLYPAALCSQPPRPHADPSPSPANRGRCRVGTEQHPCTPQMHQGQSKRYILSEATFTGIFSCACFRKQLSNDATYFLSVPSQTRITTTDKTTHPKIQLLLSLSVPLGRCCRSPTRTGNGQPRSQTPILRSTHVGAGVVEHSPGGFIDLLLEKHESKLRGQPK